MLRFFKWILLFSILAIISMNIIILTYINQQITHSNDLTTVKDIAGIMQEISVEAYLSYTIDLCHIHSTLNCSYYKDQLSASLERLRALQLTIIDDYSKWSYCAHSTIVTEEIVPVYNPDQSDYVTFLNLYGFVSEILKHGYSFLNEADYSKNQSYDELFLINNGLGGASIMLNSSFQGLLNCETERLNQNENITMIFVYASQIFVWILSLIFVIFSFKFNKLHDKLWNYIQKQANSTYFELHQACTNRLSSFHNYSSDQEELEIKKRKNPKPFILKTKLYIKFTCICSVIVIVTSVYYFSIEFIFYPSCRENLLKRYLLFEAFLYRVPVISEIIFWTINLAYHGGESVQKINGLEYPFQASGIMLESAIYRFNLLSSIIVNPSNYGMYSDDIKFKFFEGNTNPDPVYAQGTFMAAGVLLMDANYISYTNSNDISTLLPKFIQRWITFQAMVLSRISIIDNDSKIYVQNQLNTVFLATFLFSGTCFGLYFFLYLPFIRIEKRKLRKLKEISAMIPQAFDMKFKRNN
ncbi:unnamed protein product [Blepharisma stoltei]|uniref:Uncharacterized protein n=1 Tax=Blepharisma stoltei TaxID=1481888 RepID=A0AAU9JSS7_9CILI|nr:unnamed protein product [Blepharisma stoltei]